MPALNLTADCSSRLGSPFAPCSGGPVGAVVGPSCARRKSATSTARPLPLMENADTLCGGNGSDSMHSWLLAMETRALQRSRGSSRCSSPLPHVPMTPVQQESSSQRCSTGRSSCDDGDGVLPPPAFVILGLLGVGGGGR